MSSTPRITALRTGAATALTLALVAGAAASATAATATDQVAPQPGRQATASAATLPAFDRDLARLPARIGEDGTSIVVGNPKAKNVVVILEDPRCPWCKKFEDANAKQLNHLAAQGDIRLEYTLASFLDRHLGGDGSKRAVNALRASVDAGKFPQYHSELFRTQPDESDETAYENHELITSAWKVGLFSHRFVDSVVHNKYAKFVDDSEYAVEHSGALGTPTVRINGADVSDDVLYDSAKFAEALAASGIK
ncbi:MULTISPECIES: thioredoxin domain-containing protein [Streptomyces]|jgi:protein-disulfide isomerase|uniref:Protein-disulfide isomerase n=1 Tax=Streptomyces nymphaeiformis TaxID=2663842 RepID=A0A7W7U132_9ACTN|nr:thioredoxin domain-containing protein [Streptomyces nymphaeiformis]MBB4981690.1 protein-disulfide isomerase [Streptomyces nymphaeiformis]